MVFWWYRISNQTWKNTILFITSVPFYRAHGRREKWPSIYTVCTCAKNSMISWDIVYHCLWTVIAPKHIWVKLILRTWQTRSSSLFVVLEREVLHWKQRSWMQSNVSTWSGYGASFFIKLVLWCGLYGCIECKQQRHACFITKMLCIQSCVQMAINIIILHVLSCERRSQGVPCSKIVSTMVAAMI